MAEVDLHLTQMLPGCLWLGWTWSQNLKIPADNLKCTDFGVTCDPDTPRWTLGFKQRGSVFTEAHLCTPPPKNIGIQMSCYDLYAESVSTVITLKKTRLSTRAGPRVRKHWTPPDSNQPSTRTLPFLSQQLCFCQAATHIQADTSLSDHNARIPENLLWQQQGCSRALFWKLHTHSKEVLRFPSETRNTQTQPKEIWSLAIFVPIIYSGSDDCLM